MGRRSQATRYRDAGGDLRLPPPDGDIQVNACRTPGCPNFGVEALPHVDQGRPRKDGASRRDDYRAKGDDGNTADQKLFCKVCRKSFPIKSNRAIAEELRRISSYLDPIPEPGCPNPECGNATVGVFTHRVAYRRKAKLKTSDRLICKTCGTEFSVPTKPFHGQHKPHLNRSVFVEIVTKKSVRGIGKVSELNPKAIYDKVDFIYEQCRRFVGAREARAHRIKRRYIRLCTDRQDYLINWQSRRRRKNVQFTSICTVEGKTGYVLGHHLNYDPHVNQVDVDDAARVNGDLFGISRTYFHAHPQYWKSEEFSAIAGGRREEIRASVEEEPMSVEALIREKDRERSQWPMSEMADYPCRGNQLPPDGVMTHLDYTSYAHAMLVRRLIGAPRYIDVYMDQDEVLRGAFVTSLNWRVALGDVDMAYVQFHKHMDIDQKRSLANECEPTLRGLEMTYGCDREEAISSHMGDLYDRQKSQHADWRHRWVPHPRDTLNEPKRRILYLSDTGDKDLDEVGWALSGATLAPVDTYFMQIRRGLQYLERPIPSHTNAQKLYYGYSAYDPRRVAQHLEIFRVYTNYIKTDAEGVTPAMRFGLARGPVTFEDILYFWPWK